MANVLHKTADPTDYRESVDTPLFNPADWFINPDVSAVSGVPRKYWARPLTDPVTEMDQAAKDAVDAAENLAELQSRRALATGEATEGSGEGVRLRAILEQVLAAHNRLAARVRELQQALLDAKATSGNAQNMRDALPASYLPTPNITKAQVRQAYQDDINAGNQDT